MRSYQERDIEPSVTGRIEPRLCGPKLTIVNTKRLKAVN